MKLYGFFNSSTSYRVRIALALKGLSYDYLAINLRDGAQRRSAYRQLSPEGIVPLLVHDGTALTQSLAIIDYLDQTYPEPRLVPVRQPQRMRALEIAQIIACDIHPINNLRVLSYLSGELHITEAQKRAWYTHWIREGLTAVEVLLEKYDEGAFCVGDQVSVADCCLIPQIANAQRMSCDLSPYPRAMAIYAHCLALQAFQQAAPEQQPDYTRS